MSGTDGGLNKDLLSFSDIFLNQLSKKHGSVFTLWFGNSPVVVISGYCALKDTMIGMGNEFSGRANYPLLMKVTNGYGEFIYIN